MFFLWFICSTHFIADYVSELFEDLVFRREVNNSFPEARQNNALGKKDRPLPIAQSTPHAAKRDIVQAHRSRFNWIKLQNKWLWILKSTVTILLWWKCLSDFLHHTCRQNSSKTGWLEIRIMCQSWATCLPADCCFSELAL